MVSLLFKHFEHPHKELSPSSALRFTINTGRDAAFGKKYNVDKVRWLQREFSNQLRIFNVDAIFFGVD